MFGQLVVEYRQRQSMTQEELADRSGLSVRAIRDVESGRVRVPRPPSVRLLADAFGLHGAERERFTMQARGNRPTTVLPAPLTSFVGRGDELTEIAALVRANRLVTVTGVGGAGKSRLAVAVATQLAAEFPDGVWLVELAALAQADLVAPAVATALGTRGHPHRSPVEVLTDHLRTRSALLVLDNCEHLVAEVADVADRVLRTCGGVRVLATSRERLGVTGEVVRGISGLAVPAPDTTGVAAIEAADAVRLLLERTLALEPRFELTEANAAAVAQICRGIDGLPLAIELAATGVHAFGAAQVAARLDDMFRLLTRGHRTASRRHRTLWAVIDWSYLLLDDAQQRMFDQLSVFAGGFTLAAAEAVTEQSTMEDPAAVLLARLVDKSLVTMDDPAEAVPRYRMLEMLRRYGSIRLAERDATAATRERHAAYVLATVRSARRALRGEEGPEWLHRLEIERGNIRAALQWSIETGDAMTATRLASSLYPLWDQHGHYEEGRRWLRLALAMDALVPAATRARALDCAAGLAIIQGDQEEAAAASVEAAALSQQIGDAAGVARALTTTGLAAIFAGDSEHAVLMLEESLVNARRANDRHLEGTALLYLTFAALARGEHQHAIRLSEECGAVLNTVRDAEGTAWAAVLLATATWCLGRPADAVEPLRQGLRDFQLLEHVWGLSVGAEHRRPAGQRQGRPPAGDGDTRCGRSPAWVRGRGAAAVRHGMGRRRDGEGSRGTGPGWVRPRLAHVPFGSHRDGGGRRTEHAG